MCVSWCLCIYVSVVAWVVGDCIGMSVVVYVYQFLRVCVNDLYRQGVYRYIRGCIGIPVVILINICGSVFV